MASQTFSPSLKSIEEQWCKAWPDALADWSPYVQLHEPTWCFDDSDEAREGLKESFAMIRLKDHSIVISLQQIQEQKLDSFPHEILAHEIGHHVLCPADLTDNARLIARVRRGLPEVESYAPYVCNLYADLLINDRLQRYCNRRLDLVYQSLKSQEPGGNLWMLYMRIYESLWNLEPLTLTSEKVPARMNQDAILGARLVRVYAKDWLQGAGRFACLCYPYVVAELESKKQRKRLWCDTLLSGGNHLPSGLTEIEDDELLGAIHPVEDPELSGLAPIDLGDIEGNGQGRVKRSDSGRKSIKNYRGPMEYLDILAAAGVDLPPREIAVRYYRERALPHLIPFPVRIIPQMSDPLPEGLDLWDPSSEFERIDWLGTLTTSPVVIPGITTRERLTGESPGHESERKPIDLYLGVDCSGSMPDPAAMLSYPILAGAVIALSALRVGSHVKVVLSGEPGQSIATDGFIRQTHDIIHTMVSYLGTGYAFGIHRLHETFHQDLTLPRPAHILLVSDYDMFTILDATVDGRLGWDVAREAVRCCRGGGTYVLQLSGYSESHHREFSQKIARMKSDGWNVFLVNSMEELLDFARQFSRTHYHNIQAKATKS